MHLKTKAHYAAVALTLFYPPIFKASAGVSEIKIPRYRYPEQFENIDTLLDKFRGMLLQGSYVLSEEVTHFETLFAEYCGCQIARGVNSGTDALVVAMRALDIQPGDEVITQANTFHATVAAIVMVGAKRFWWTPPTTIF